MSTDIMNDNYNVLYVKATKEVDSFMKSYQAVPNEQEAEFLSNVLFNSSIRPVTKHQFQEFCSANDPLTRIVPDMLKRLSTTDKAMVYNYTMPFNYVNILDDPMFNAFYEDETNKRKILNYYYKCMYKNDGPVVPTNDLNDVMRNYIHNLHANHGLSGKFNTRFNVSSKDSLISIPDSKLVDRLCEHPFVQLVTLAMPLRLRYGYMMRVLVRYALEHNIKLSCQRSGQYNIKHIFSEVDVIAMYHNTFGQSVTLGKVLAAFQFMYTRFIACVMNYNRMCLTELDVDVPLFADFCDYNIFDPYIDHESLNQQLTLMSAIGLQFARAQLFKAEFTELHETPDRTFLIDVFYPQIAVREHFGREIDWTSIEPNGQTMEIEDHSSHPSVKRFGDPTISYRKDSVDILRDYHVQYPLNVSMDFIKYSDIKKKYYGKIDKVRLNVYQFDIMKEVLKNVILKLEPKKIKQEVRKSLHLIKDNNTDIYFWVNLLRQLKNPGDIEFDPEFKISEIGNYNKCEPRNNCELVMINTKVPSTEWIDNSCLLTTELIAVDYKDVTDYDRLVKDRQICFSSAFSMKDVYKFLRFKNVHDEIPNPFTPVDAKNELTTALTFTEDRLVLKSTDVIIVSLINLILTTICYHVNNKMDDLLKEVAENVVVAEPEVVSADTEVKPKYHLHLVPTADGGIEQEIVEPE